MGRSSIGKLPVAITNISDKAASKDERFVLIHGSRSFHPWSLGPLALGLCQLRVSRWKGVVEKGCLLRGS